MQEVRGLVLRERGAVLAVPDDVVEELPAAAVLHDLCMEANERVD